MRVVFECVVCGREAPATVDDDGLDSRPRPLETLRECPACGMETIWVET
ncbi:MAG: hypothetical protein R3324_05015 [Halobacteriales archaeon]|nr:hypothetical protein [Halobacteriales archaeon]